MTTLDPTAAPTLAERLAAAGEPQSVLGNQPVALADSAAWVVLDGRLELFARDRRDGRRTHLASLGPERLMLGTEAGVPDPATPSELIAVAVGAVELRRIPLAELRRLAREPGAVEGLAELVEGWVETLFERILDTPPPQRFAPLEAAAEAELAEPGTAARPRAGLLWVRHLAGASRYLGHAELPMAPAEHLLPVSRRTWLVAAEPGTRVSCVRTEILLRGGGLWEGLAAFHRLFLDYVELRGLRSAELERERLGDRLARDRRTLARATSTLASVLGTGLAAQAEAGDGADALLAACRLVGGAAGIRFRRPPEGRSGGPQEARLSAICASSRVRHRRVILRDDWWCRDNGPLLGFLVHEGDARVPGRPVALLPRSADRYELVDPESEERSLVDAEVAAGLTGFAYMFYPPLPERRSGAADLLRLGLAGSRADLTMLVAIGVAGGLLAAVVPVVTGRIVGRVIPDAARDELYQLFLALVVAALASAAFQVTRSLAILRLGGRIDGSSQAAVWDRLLRLPVWFFRRFAVGDLTARSMGIDQIRELVTGSVITSVLGAVFSVFSFALLFFYSMRLALLATGMVSLMTLVTVLLVWLQLRHQRALLELQGRISSMLFGFIQGLSKLRVAGAEQRAYALWAERFAEQRRVAVRARRVAIVQIVFNAAFGVLSLLGLFALVGFKLLDTLPLPDYLAFSAAYAQFQGAMLATVGAFSGILGMVPLYERLLPILEEPPEIDESRAEAGELRGDVEFSHVSFRYHPDGPPILDEVSFRAGPGEFVALVGPSGAGKSTCLRLLLGFETPVSGSIYYDGMDLPSLDLPSVRRQIGVVLQGGQPMAGDLFSNIVGSTNLTLDDAWRAAAMAGLADDIKAMPMGMHTVVSEGAGTLSGGQKQRLLIARAVVNQPRILLFDEATSALDNRTQELVSRSLEQLKATRIVVAHRLSTILRADRIYVFDRGRVVEEGTYDELVSTGGVFARLAARQTA